VRASRPPRIYYSHVALVSSIREPSSFFFSRRGEWDALMEDDVGVDSKTAVGGYLQMALFVELQKDKTGVSENTFLVVTTRILTSSPYYYFTHSSRSLRPIFPNSRSNHVGLG